MKFLSGLIAVLCLFAASMLISYVICLINEKKAKKNATQNSDAKIYYITNFERKPKPRPKKSTKPDIALKGTVLRPEEFHKFFIDENTRNTK